MNFAVFYTPLSEETLLIICDTIEGEFGKKAAEEFNLKAEKIIDLIALQPFMFKASPVDFNVRIALITKQSSLYYRVTETEIHLLYFWDNRQDPIFL